MSRHSKKPPVKTNRSINDFFTRKPTTRTAQSASSGSQSPKTKDQFLSLSSTSSEIKTSITTLGAPISPAKITVSRRTTKSPDIWEVTSCNSQSPTYIIRPPPVKQHKSKFESDSDGEKSGPVVYVSRSSIHPTSTTNSPVHRPAPLCPRENLTHKHLQATTPLKKKLRPSFTESWTKSPHEYLVPSSQSDEHEMVQTSLSQHDPIIVKTNIDVQCHMSSSPLTPQLGTIDGPTSEAPLPPVSPNCRHANLSPVLNHFLPASPLPVSLDPETKAARIIADIKAKAYAVNLLNQSDAPIIEFKDELSDSSDELDCVPWSPSDRSKGKDEAPRLTLSFNSSKQSPGRYYHHSPQHPVSPSTSKTLPPFSNSSQGSCMARTAVTSQKEVKKRKKEKVYNPLDELLNEKRMADKGGTGDEAFRQAEAAMANGSSMLQDMKDPNDWTNEYAARMAVIEREYMFMGSPSPVVSESVDDSITLDEEEGQRLFGKEGGKAIVDILESDKIRNQKESEQGKVSGVPFWSDRGLEDPMEADETTFPVLDILDQHPVISLFKSAMEHKNYDHAALLIGSGALFSINSVDYPAVISYLCQLALSPDKSILSTPSVQSLIYIWDNTLHSIPGISFSQILPTLVCLGAKSSVLSTMDWVAPPGISRATIGQSHDDLLYRLVVLITSSARSRRLLNGEISDILMALILIANDPSSLAYLQCEIVIAIDEVCRSIASGVDISPILESTICTRILIYASTLEPVDKAYIVSLLGSGTGRTRRIARWVAHGIIADRKAIHPKDYSDLPDLFPILQQLTLKHSNETKKIVTHGKFEQHGKTDFVDMTFYVRILSVAITNVPGYIAKEHKGLGISWNAGQSAEEEPTLFSVRLAIESLHSGISDIHATHLDRSRTKAALKELSLRIHYQRLAAVQNARTLHQYFTKKKR